MARKEGKCSKKVADLNEFWSGQKNIELFDPNTLACPEWEDILTQLKESHSWVNFNQGMDVRMITDKKLQLIKDIKIKHVHFAWDRYEDKDLIVPRLQMFKDATGWNRSKVSCYVLCNFNTTMEQNMERIMFLRSLDFNPYVMIYDKEHVQRGSQINALARWVNFKPLFWKYNTFEEYCRNEIKTERKWDT